MLSLQGMRTKVHPERLSHAPEGPKRDLRPLAHAPGSLPWLRGLLPGHSTTGEETQVARLADRHFHTLVAALPDVAPELSKVEKLPPGVYRLEAGPTIPFLRSMHTFRGSTAELGLFRHQGKWLLSVSEGPSMSLPAVFRAVGDHIGFDVNLHSHPGQDALALLPSFEDAFHVGKSRGGAELISTAKGLLVFGEGVTRNEALGPGGNFTHYVEARGLTKDAYEAHGPLRVQQEFFEDRFGLRTVAWSDTQELERLLQLPSRKAAVDAFVGPGSGG